MAQNELYFSCLEDSTGGALASDDVKLFYYDIGFDSEMKTFPYMWDDEMEEFTQKNRLVIKELQNGSLPESVSANEIYFTEYFDREDKVKVDKAMAFLRHLRNAFAHYRIGISGDYYCLKDENDKGTTMIGKIDKRLFQDLIKIYFEQKAKAEEKYRDYLYPEL